MRFFCLLTVSSGVSWEEWWTYDGISGKEIGVRNKFTVSGENA